MRGVPSDKLGKRLAGSVSKLRVRSALNPALWFCGITLPAVLFSLPLLPPDPPVWMIVLIFVPVCTVAIGFFFLLFFDRDKLQSEDYQLQKRSMELIYQKGETPMDGQLVEAVANPEIKMLQNGN